MNVKGKIVHAKDEDEDDKINKYVGVDQSILTNLFKSCQFYCCLFALKYNISILSAD